MREKSNKNAHRITQPYRENVALSDCKTFNVGSIPTAAFNNSLPFNNLRAASLLPVTKSTDLCEKPLSCIFTPPRCVGKYLLVLSVAAPRKDFLIKFDN